MLKKVDDFLNKTTMYRLTLYCVGGLWLLALVFSFVGILYLNPINLIVSLALIFGICVLTNELFARIYKAPSNDESIFITAFILASIISPFATLNDIIFLVLASVLAMASKYVLAINKKHIFNPAAAGVVVAALITNQSAAWWMGTISLAPFVLIAGLLISRKIRRLDLFFSFLVSAFVFIIGYGIFTGQSFSATILGALFNSPVLYLGSIMVTEPMTTPPTKKLRMAYGALVGLLNAPFTGFAGFYTTPEIALVIGNAFSYFVSPKQKLILTFKGKVKIAKDTYNFVFNPSKKINFKPGQYLEWTLAHNKKDNRGMRRYFTIASSPTEDEIIMGVKFYENPSTYKKALLAMNSGEKMIGSQLTGDFTLPKDKNKKLIFIAGGIGITPFRSMVKYLIDKNEKRDIFVFYSNRGINDVAYQSLFDVAQQKFGIKTVYCLSDANLTPQSWKGEKGFINEEMIKKYAPDFMDRMFYISGPRSMVLSFQKVLKDARIHKSHIKTDFFPGFA